MISYSKFLITATEIADNANTFSSGKYIFNGHPITFIFYKFIDIFSGLCDTVTWAGVTCAGPQVRTVQYVTARTVNYDVHNTSA